MIIFHMISLKVMQNASPFTPIIYWPNCAEGVWWATYIESDIWFQTNFWEASSLGFHSSFSKAWYLEEVRVNDPVFDGVGLAGLRQSQCSFIGPCFSFPFSIITLYMCHSSTLCHMCHSSTLCHKCHSSTLRHMCHSSTLWDPIGEMPWTLWYLPVINFIDVSISICKVSNSTYDRLLYYSFEIISHDKLIILFLLLCELTTGVLWYKQVQNIRSAALARVLNNEQFAWVQRDARTYDSRVVDPVGNVGPWPVEIWRLRRGNARPRPERLRSVGRWEC